MVGLMNDIRFGIKKNINIWSVFSEYFDLINCKQLENSKTQITLPDCKLLVYEYTMNIMKIVVDVLYTVQE